MSPWYVAEIILAIVLGVVAGLFLFPKTRRQLSARFMGVMTKAYQKQMANQFKAKFPPLYERFSGFRLGPDSQAALQAAMKRIPPQEGVKLQAEFMRLTDGFLSRHPELTGFVDALKAQNAQGQAKELQKVMRLKKDPRDAISKDLLWAYDQLGTRFPRWVKTLEAAAKGPTEKVLEPAGKN